MARERGEGVKGRQEDTAKIKPILESRVEESKKPSREEIIGELLRKNFKDGEIDCELHYLGTRQLNR